MIGKEFDKVIKAYVKEICINKEVPDDVALIQTDNLGEIIEKLIIVHIRMWMLEDRLGMTDDVYEIANLKKKTDICFKIKRPKLVEAINLIVNNAIVNNKSLVEESVKLYKGVGE